MKAFFVITGMHRSGTSFLSRALNLSGVHLGKYSDLISDDWNPLKDNPRGHWENKTLLDLAEETLQHNHGSWNNIPKTIVLDDNLKKTIQKSLLDLYNSSPLAVGFKDPRMCLCFESWNELFPEKPIILGIFRHPLKVAESLKTRNGFDYQKSLELWNIYNQNMLDIIEKHGGFVLDFDWNKEKLLAEIDMIKDKLNLPKIDLALWHTDELIRSDKTYDSSYSLSNETQEIYSKLIEKSKQNKSVKVHVHDYTQEYSKIISFLLVQIQENGIYFKDLLSNLQSQVSNLESQIKQKDDKISNLESQIKQKDDKISNLESQIKQKYDKISNLESQIKQKEDKIIELENSFWGKIGAKFTKSAK